MAFCRLSHLSYCGLITVTQYLPVSAKEMLQTDTSVLAVYRITAMNILNATKKQSLIIVFLSLKNDDDPQTLVHERFLQTHEDFLQMSK